MTVEEVAGFVGNEGAEFIYTASILVDEEISILKRLVNRDDLDLHPTKESGAANLIQSSFRVFQERRSIRTYKNSAILIQSSARMMKARQRTLRVVRDGQYSPLVTLRGKYLCGRPNEEDNLTLIIKQPSDFAVEEPVKITQEKSTEVTERKSLIPKRASRRSSTVEGSKVARLISDSRDPTVFDESGLPLPGPLLTRLTLDNTKRNSLYTTCKIRVEEVEAGVPRPESPPRAFSKKPLVKGMCFTSGEEEDDGDVEEARLRWAKKLVFLDEMEPKSPLDPEIDIPIKPILKRAPTNPAGLHLPEPEEILVKKILWVEETPVDYGVEDIMDDVPAAKGKGGRKKKNSSDGKQKGRVKGQPERVKQANVKNKK